LEKKQFIKENNKTHSEWWISSLKPLSGLSGGKTPEWRPHVSLQFHTLEEY